MVTNKYELGNPKLTPDLSIPHSSENGAGPSADLTVDDLETVLLKNPPPGCRNSCEKLLVILLVVFTIALVTIICLYFIVLEQNQRRCQSANCLRIAAKMFNNLDATVDPCDNFYRHACGGYESEGFIEYDEVEKSPLKDANDIKEYFFKDQLENQLTSNNRKPYWEVAKFYRSCLNDPQINKKTGFIPVRDFIKKHGGMDILGGWDAESWSFTDALLSTTSLGYSTLFEFGVLADLSIEIPGRLLNYSWAKYVSKTKSDKVYLDFHNSFQKYLNEFAGVRVADSLVTEVINFHIDLLTLAKNAMVDVNAPSYSYSSIKQAEMMGLPIPGYPTYNFSELHQILPEIDWPRLISGLLPFPTNSSQHIQVANHTVAYLKALSSLLKNTPERVRNNYIWTIFAYDSQRYLSHISNDEKISLPFPRRKEDNPFMTMDTMGHPSDVDSSCKRWKYCMIMTSYGWNNFSVWQLALESLFLERYMKGKLPDKSKLDDMHERIVKAFVANLQKLTWMDEKTKKACEQKANNMKKYLYYPEYLKNETFVDSIYSHLNLHLDKYYDNSLVIDAWKVKRSLLVLEPSIQEAVAQQGWILPIYSVNAFYMMPGNQFWMLAGAMDSPYYYGKDVPKYLNYAGIGSLMGHEITHGFDNKGRLYDQNGKMSHRWWTARTSENFQKRAVCFIKQYRNYSVILPYSKQPVHINGTRTLAENLADNGGIRVALEAYDSYAESHGEEPQLPLLDMANEQSFFLAFAQAFCRKADPLLYTKELFYEEHSPNEYRVNGVLQNMDRFSQAFKCSAGAPMNPVNKCRIW
ncbi:endothelin-converting enzyme homolog [Tubulanus polymorphus]|uniref:endothelin-converting enzyme homolog n=1 Tax=Tubulanus polymorphus TaxID=672921 RepID=UPI003DA617F4